MHVLIHSSSACDAFVFVRVLTSYFRSTDCGDHASIRVHILQIRAFRILDMRHVEAMRRSRSANSKRETVSKQRRDEHIET